MPKNKSTVEMTISPRSIEGLRRVGIKLPVVRHLGDGNSVVKWPADQYEALQQFKVRPGMTDDDAVRLMLLVGAPADGTTRRPL